MHVGVKLLDKHERTGNRDVTQWLLSPTVNDRGKVQQNDLAFRMNATSRKVLWKCLKGIIITELNMRKCRIRRRRSIGMKKVSGLSGSTLRCHRHDWCKQKERERKKRQSEKFQAISNITSVLKREYVCMGNAWTCGMQRKLHHGLNPIQTYQHTNR